MHYYAKFDKCIFSVYNIKCQDFPKAIFAGIFRPNFILLKAAFGGGKGDIFCEKICFDFSCFFYIAACILPKTPESVMDGNVLRAKSSNDLLVESLVSAPADNSNQGGTTVGYKKNMPPDARDKKLHGAKNSYRRVPQRAAYRGDKGILIARCIRVIHKFGRFLGGAAAALVCIMFIFSATVSALPLDIGFSTTKLSAEERNRFLGSINFESTNKEPDWESISCFDVSDSGYIAIVGESKNGHNSISVYDKDGKFAYGYTLDCSGRFGVGWNGDNIAVYFVREDIAATFDRNANNITCDEIPDTTANSSYWSNEVLYKTRRVKNGVRYEMKNTGKVASAISPSYAVFEMTEPDGTVHVIFDNSKDYDIKLIKTCIEVVVSFAVVASILTLKTIEDRKKIKQKINKSELNCCNR